MTGIAPPAAIEDVVFHVSNALRVPVLIAALLALAVVLIEFGRLAVELARRRRRDPLAIERAGKAARVALADGDAALAEQCLLAVVSSPAMAELIRRVLAELASAVVDGRVLTKSVADFDLASLRRLERTRVLVRAGPALGLMGTLIPLSPALTGLANGNAGQLTANLRVAFSVTVLGLLIGVLAFGISLVRDRVYAQDLSDVEFLAAEIEAGAADRDGRS
jgi:biopolymer transport protein ExbB/TolQ